MSNQQVQVNYMAKKQDIIIALIIFGSVAVFVLFLAIFVISLSSSSDLAISSPGNKVGLIELNGVITTPRNIVKQFKDFSKDENIKAIVFRIDSPGGGVAASQEIFEMVRRVSDKGLPVVASMGTVAASAADPVKAAVPNTAFLVFVDFGSGIVLKRDPRCC